MDKYHSRRQGVSLDMSVWTKLCEMDRASRISLQRMSSAAQKTGVHCVQPTEITNMNRLAGKSSNPFSSFPPVENTALQSKCIVEPQSAAPGHVLFPLSMLTHSSFCDAPQSAGHESHRFDHIGPFPWSMPHVPSQGVHGKVLVSGGAICTCFWEASSQASE